MKTMKNVLSAVLIAALIMPVIQGCKKGAEDPGISLKSRDSRIVGVWNLTLKDDELVSTDATVDAGDSWNNSSTTTTDFDGSDETIVTSVSNASNVGGFSTSFSSSTTTVDGLVLELTLFKDGTYSYKQTVTPKSSNYSDSGGSSSVDLFTNEKEEDIATGRWEWLDSKKNKTHLVTDDFGVVYLLRLTNKEMIWEQNTTDEVHDTETGKSFDDVDTWTSKWTWEKTGKPEKNTTE